MIKQLPQKSSLGFEMKPVTKELFKWRFGINIYVKEWGSIPAIGPGWSIDLPHFVVIIISNMIIIMMGAMMITIIMMKLK